MTSRSRSVPRRSARPHQFDQCVALLEEAYSFEAGNLVMGSPLAGSPALRSAASILVVLMRDVEQLPYMTLASWIDATIEEVKSAESSLRSLMFNDPAVDHAVQRFKFALAMLRDYRPVVPTEGFVMPGEFGIVAEQHLAG